MRPWALWVAAVLQLSTCGAVDLGARPRVQRSGFGNRVVAGQEGVVGGVPGTLARDEDVLHVMSGGLDKVDLHSAGMSADKGIPSRSGRAADGAAPESAPTGIEGVVADGLEPRAPAGGAVTRDVTLAPTLVPVSRMKTGASKGKSVDAIGGQTHFDVDVVKHRKEERRIRGVVEGDIGSPPGVDSPTPTIFVVVAISTVVCAIVSLFAA